MDLNLKKTIKLVNRPSPKRSFNRNRGSYSRDYFSNSKSSKSKYEDISLGESMKRKPSPKNEITKNTEKIENLKETKKNIQTPLEKLKTQIINKNVKFNLSKKEESPNKIIHHKQNRIDKYYVNKDITKPKNIIEKSPKISNRKKSHESKKNKSCNNKNTHKSTHKKVLIKTNIDNYKDHDNMFSIDLLNKNKNNFKYYQNIPNIEDKYISSIITDGIIVNKVSF